MAIFKKFDCFKELIILFYIFYQKKVKKLVLIT